MSVQFNAADAAPVEYTLPQNVVSPQAAITDLRVLYDGGAEGDYDNPLAGYSVALCTWYDTPDVVLFRWNGNAGRPKGTPVSRGYPTWVVMPEPFAKPMLDWALAQSGKSRPEPTPLNRVRAAVNNLIAAGRELPMEEWTRLQVSLSL